MATAWDVARGAGGDGTAGGWVHLDGVKLTKGWQAHGRFFERVNCSCRSGYWIGAVGVLDDLRTIDLGGRHMSDDAKREAWAIGVGIPLAILVFIGIAMMLGGG